MLPGERERKYVMLLRPQRERGWKRAFPLGPSGLGKLWWSWALEESFWSLGHVLSHGLPHFILQVRQFLPLGLQVQPLIVWHLKRRINKCFKTSLRVTWSYFKHMATSKRMQFLEQDKKRGLNKCRFYLSFSTLFIWYLLIRKSYVSSVIPRTFCTTAKPFHEFFNFHNYYSSLTFNWTSWVPP